MPKRSSSNIWNLGAIIGLSVCLQAGLVAEYSVSCRNSGLVGISLMTSFGHTFSLLVIEDTIIQCVIWYSYSKFRWERISKNINRCVCCLAFLWLKTFIFLPDLIKDLYHTIDISTTFLKEKLFYSILPFATVIVFKYLSRVIHIKV